MVADTLNLLIILYGCMDNVYAVIMHVSFESSILWVILHVPLLYNS